MMDDIPLDMIFTESPRKNRPDTPSASTTFDTRHATFDIWHVTRDTTQTSNGNTIYGKVACLRRHKKGYKAARKWYGTSYFSTATWRQHNNWCVGVGVLEENGTAHAKSGHAGLIEYCILL
jgi:hypothetical protein